MRGRRERASGRKVVSFIVLDDDREDRLIQRMDF